VKLHLGCGERYLDGYVNIDFPPSEHAVQTKSVADQHADVLGLRYPAGSVEEVRLHHVFEHFERQVACALLAGWGSWLRVGGTLHLEVPDVVRTWLAALSPFAPKGRSFLAARHIFGSHEAPWAAHREGYSPRMLGGMLEAFGFAVADTRRNHWRGTHNFEMTARKASALSRSEYEAAARRFLGRFLVDTGESETRLLETWMAGYRRQADRCWAVER